MKRINNFHKSKPIVQNVKTDSVNEGKAPKNLTLDNDISDWNPGVSHEQITEAGSTDISQSFEAAVSKNDQKGQGGGAAAPTSYSQAVDRFLRVNGLQSTLRRMILVYNKNQEIAQRTESDLDELTQVHQDSLAKQADVSKYLDSLNTSLSKMKSGTKEYQKMQDEIDQTTNKLSDVSTEANRASIALDNANSSYKDAVTAMDAAREKGENAANRLNTLGVKPDFGDDDPKENPPKKDIPGEDEPPREVPAKEVPSIGAPIAKPGGAEGPVLILDPSKILDGEAPYQDVGYKDIDQSISKGAAQSAKFREELANPDEEAIPNKAIETVREFEPTGDLHELAKAGGVGMDMAAAGARFVQIYTHFYECGNTANSYSVAANLSNRNYPTVWKSPIDPAIDYVIEGTSSDNKYPNGSAYLYSGDYTGPTGLTCLP